MLKLDKGQLWDETYCRTSVGAENADNLFKELKACKMEYKQF